MAAGLEGWVFGKPLDEGPDVPHTSSGGPSDGQRPSSPIHSTPSYCALTVCRPLQGTEDIEVDGTGQPQALPVHRLREVSDRKTHGE